MDRVANKAKWQNVINSWSESGQTQARWCDENDVNIHNFRYWKSRLVTESEDISKKAFGFVSLKSSSKSGGTLNVRIGSATIEVCNAADLSLFESVVSVLMHYA